MLVLAPVKSFLILPLSFPHCHARSSSKHFDDDKPFGKAQFLESFSCKKAFVKSLIVQSFGKMAGAELVLPSSTFAYRPKPRERLLRKSGTEVTEEVHEPWLTES